MNCNTCGKTAVENTDLCGDCIVKAVEKRARKVLSKSGMSRDSKIAVVNDRTLEGEVNAHLIRKLVTMTKNIKHAENTPRGDYSFTSVPDSADREAERFMGFMLSSGNKLNTVNTENVIKLLKGSLSSELAAYAKIKRIKYSKKEDGSDIAVLLNSLERRYKGTKFALAKASEEMEWEQTKRAKQEQ